MQSMFGHKILEKKSGTNTLKRVELQNTLDFVREGDYNRV